MRRLALVLVFLLVCVPSVAAQYSVPPRALLAPYASGDVARVFVFAHHPSQNALERQRVYWGMTTTNVYGLERMASQLYAVDPWLKQGAWQAHRAGDSWQMFYTPRWKYGAWPTPGRVDALLDALFSLAIDGEVYWSQATGFVPPIGDLGLVSPYGELALLMADGSTRWLILGNVARDGASYAIIIERLERGADGQPHPNTPHVRLAGDVELVRALMEVGQWQVE